MANDKNLEEKMSFEEYVELVGQIPDSGVLWMMGVYDNLPIFLGPDSPVRARDELIKTGKFESLPYSSDYQGRYQLCHPETDSLVAIQYQQARDDHRTFYAKHSELPDPRLEPKWTEVKSPSDLRISIHPQYVAAFLNGLDKGNRPRKFGSIPYGFLVQKVLPDLLLFGKQGRFSLRVDGGKPLLREGESAYIKDNIKRYLDVVVEYHPGEK